ncbi:hypothetical protein [Palleronia sp. LCG004]|uniref:hypothetical protein n=1 Tax=Palleronia sp. LCG004 TaxID=3079304 RepID=UPI002943F23D|nr:hypothetical protein [Palleronia sp. LCG004]WOI56628.1 hypothetical protein RVY76_02170 [Palleronia sp. LCG004]
MHRSLATSWSDPALADATILSWRAAAAAFCLSALLCWPMLVFGGPIVFFDTGLYIGNGAELWSRFADALGWSGSVGDDAARPEIGQLRSVSYALWSFVTSRTFLWARAPALLQTWMTILMLMVLIPRGTLRRPLWMILSAMCLAAVTTLPWYASYAMPDLLAATLVLFYAGLATRLDRAGWGWRVFLLAVGSFAVSSHYGNIPLAAGLAVIVVVLRLARGRLAAWHVAWAVLPILATLALNSAGSQVSGGGGSSIAPKRLPILLARSVADGPALDYLSGACPAGADLAICRLMPEIPGDVETFLWSDAGIQGLDAEGLAAIRDEEIAILWHAFLAYPGRQAEALLGNATRQLFEVGTDDLYPALRGDQEEMRAYRDSFTILAVFDPVVKLGTFLLCAFALWLALARIYTREEALALAVCLAGILGNAAIFGGLSAPVDRYQSRLVWVVPALALLAWSRHAAGRSIRHRGRSP